MTGPGLGRDLVAGDLTTQALPDVLQFLQSLRRSGHVALEDAGPPVRAAALHMHDGALAHADLPPWQGDEAVLRILAWRRGRFAFMPGPPPRLRTVHCELQALLLEAARIIDMRNALAKRIGPGPLHRQLQPPAGHEITLSLDQVRILEAIDGRRSLEDLFDALPLPQADLISMIEGLLLAGVIGTRADDRALTGIVLRRLPAEHRSPATPVPGLHGGLLVRACDGEVCLSELGKQLSLTPWEVLAAARHLVAHGWAQVAVGQEIWCDGVG